MANVVLKNTLNGAKVTLQMPFDECEYVRALTTIGAKYDQEKWMTGEVKELGIAIDNICTDTPAYDHMYESQNPVLINLAENIYADAWQLPIEMYFDEIGVCDIEEFCNVCMQSEEIAYYSYDEGYWHEGYGRELLRYRFEAGEIPQELEEYIDYDSYGQDQAQCNDDYIGEYGYLAGDGGIDVNYYGTNEIYEWANWDVEYELEEVPTKPQLTADIILNIL